MCEREKSDLSARLEIVVNQMEGRETMLDRVAEETAVVKTTLADEKASRTLAEAQLLRLTEEYKALRSETAGQLEQLLA